MSDNQSENAGDWGGVWKGSTPPTRATVTIDDVLQAEAELEEAEHQLALAKKKLSRAVVMSKQQQTPLTWQYVFYSQHTRWAPAMIDAMSTAKGTGYPYFSWNGRIYWTDDGTDTTYLNEDVK